MSHSSGFRFAHRGHRVVAATTACSSPNEPGGVFRTEVTLRPGQVTAVASTPLRIGFERVAADSRCPSTALCIQSGDALVVFNVSVGDRGGAEIRLRTRRRHDRPGS